MEMDHVYIDYLVYYELKNSKYRLNKGFRNFTDIHELDQGVIFFDSNHEFIDPKRFEFENIIPEKVLIPRFLWEEFKDKLKDFRVLDPKNNKLIEYSYFERLEAQLKNNYKIDLSRTEIEMRFPPRENQAPIIEAILNKIKSDDYNIRGILKGLPGIGKTFLSINLTQYFKKSIIMVPKEVLVSQWIKEILAFTMLERENIGIIQGSNPDEIKAIMDDPNIKIIITKPQSILSQIKRIKYYDLIEFYKSIELVIFDEAHNSGANGFSKAISLFKTPNVFGVTATPFRNGLNELLLRGSIGDVFYTADAEVLTPKIQLQRIPKEKITFTESELKALNRVRGDYIQFLTMFNMILTKKDAYFEYLAQWVKYYNHFGHKNIVLFNTIKMINKMDSKLQALYSNLPENLRPKILKLTGNSKKDALDIAKSLNKEIKAELKELKETLDEKVKAKELRRKDANEIYKEERELKKEIMDKNLEDAEILYAKSIKEADIIIGTYGLLREGFDKSELSHVIFGSPVIGITSLIQVIGRVTRLGGPDKLMPIAQFFLLEYFLEQNPHAMMTIVNNCKKEYPEAIIEYI